MKLGPQVIQSRPGTVGELQDGWIRPREECAFTVASNLLKCGLNGEEEIRKLLIDLDLQ